MSKFKILVEQELKQKKFRLFFTVLLLAAGFLMFSNPARAAVGLQVGNSSLNLGAGENLYYGNIASGTTTSNILLLQKAGADIFRITSAGNVQINAETVNSNILHLNNPSSRGLIISSYKQGVYDDGGTKFLKNSSVGEFKFSNSVLDLMTLKADGSVGIGTTNPTSLLHVQGNYSGGSDNLIPQMKIINTATTSSYAFIKTMIGTGYGGGYPELWVQAAGGISGTVGIRGVSSHDLTFSASNTEWMRIKKDGNVGVGTTNPGVKLTITGPGDGWPVTTGSTQTYGISRFGQSGNNEVLDIGANAGLGAWLQSANSGNLSINYPLLLNPNGGNVGIGTTAPNDIFSIGNAGAAPAGSVNTGHNFTSTYLSTDNFALANYGLVQTMIASATSSSALWGGTTG